MSRRRGAVYFADLGPQLGRKPVLVVSTAPINAGLHQPLCALITSRDRKRTVPTFVPIDPPEGGLREPSFVLCHHLLTLREDLIDPEPQGVLTAFTMLELDEALKVALDLT